MPEILIGNVRGPQGEVGPRNLLLATTYQFAASDTADTIPTEWYSETPIVEQGQYCWCKNTMTWEEGEDTNLYSVGYLGRDGEFNGIELVNGLGERITALENRTTPISKGGTEATTLQGAQAKLGITALQEAIDTLKKTMASATQAGLMSAQNFTDLNNLKAAWDSAPSIKYQKDITQMEFLNGTSLPGIQPMIIWHIGDNRRGILINFSTKSIRCVDYENRSNDFTISAQQLSACFYNLGMISSSKRLQSGDDLNELLEPGTYCANSSSIAASIKNSPTGMAFKVFVELSSGTNSNFVRQTLAVYNATNATKRVTTDGGKTWTDWKAS